MLTVTALQQVPTCYASQNLYNLSTAPIQHKQSQKHAHIQCILCMMYGRTWVLSCSIHLVSLHLCSHKSFQEGPSPYPFPGAQVLSHFSNGAFSLMQQQRPTAAMKSFCCFSHSPEIAHFEDKSNMTEIIPSSNHGCRRQPSMRCFGARSQNIGWKIHRNHCVERDDIIFYCRHWIFFLTLQILRFLQKNLGSHTPRT